MIGGARVVPLLMGAWLFATMGCREEREDATTDPSRHRTAPAEAAGSKPPEPPAPRVPSAAGWRLEGEGARRRVPVDPGEVLSPEGDAETLVVDLRGGGRLEVAPGSLARLGGPGSEATLLVGRGRARARVNPGGPIDRDAVRLATPEVSVELARSGDVLALSLPDGRTWVVVLSGHPTLLTGATDDEGRLRRWPMAPGQAVWVTADGPEEPTEGPSRVGDAVAAMDALQHRVGEGPPDGVPRRFHAAVTGLQEALDALEREGARGRTLSRAHRQAVADDSDRAATLRSEIVAHSKALLRLRQQVRARWERMAARALAAPVGAGDASEANAHGARVERVLARRP